MAYNLRFWYEYKDIADTLNRVEILYNGYAGDSYEVIAGATPFVPSINEGEGNKGGEIIDTLFSLQAVTSSQFNIEAFDSEAYGDVIFKYYHDSVLKYQGVIDAFETNQELLPNGTTVLILSAESGIKNLGKVYLKNSDDTAISGKVRIIEVIAKALRLLNAQNTANIVSIVNTSVYEGSTQVNADKDLFENITNIETFQNDNGEILTAYEAIKRCLGGIYTLKYFENQWYIEHIEAYTQASYYKTVYNYSGTRISRTSVTRTLKNIFEGDILRGGTEGKLFSKGKIVVKRNINSLISSLPNSDFEPIGSQLVHWTGVSSLSNSILGGYGTVDQPFYLQINGSVYDNTTPDTEFVESGSFNWYPYGRSDFENRPDANMYDEDEKLKFNLKNEYGSGISGARVQIMATYAFMDEDTQMPTMTPGTEEDISFTTFTYYYTNNGWSLDPGFYVTGNNAIESIEVDPPAVNRMGYFRYRSANTGTYYLKSPPTVSVKIRLFRGARLKIGASTNEESGYTYFVRYFRVTSSVWTQDEEILQSKVEKTYLTANNTDRLGNVDIGLDMYYPLYPYAFGSIFKDSSTNTPISGYKKPGESTIQAYDLFVGQSYLRRNSSRLHRMYIIKKSFDVSPDTLLTYDSKVYRIVKYDFNQRYGNCDMTILEVANNGVAISEKVSVSENQTVLDSSYKKVIYPPKAGDDRIKVDKYGNISLNHELNNITSFNKSGGYINLQKEDNEESSGVYFTNADGTMAQAMTPSAIGFDFKSDLNNFKVELDLSELTKDVKVATDDSAWMLGGNDLVTKAFIGGKAGNFDLGVKRNNIEVATFVSSGLSLPQMAAVTTDTDKFVVNDSGVLKYRTGTQILSDIGAFASPTGLTTNYVTKWNGTTLVNSQIFDNGTNVGIGTYTNFGGGKVSVEHNSSFPNGLVVNAAGSSISPTLYLRNAIDGYKGRILFPYYGITFEDLSGINRLLINELGNIGIGTANPAYKLDVNGTGHFTGAVTFDTVPSSLQDATSANHLVRYSQWISTTTVKYLPTAVKTVSLSNITLSGTQTVSGVALIAGDRILVAGQTTQSENGIYVVAAGAWSRATDSDTDTELRGFIVSVSNGTYGGYKYINTNQSTITVGTTAVTYAEFSNLSEIDPVFIAWRDLSRTANTVLATPNGSAGAASFRSLVTADISNLNSYSSFSNYTSTTDLNTLLSGKSDTSHTHSFNSLTSIPTTVAGYGIVLVSSDIPSLDWSKITTGKPTTLSGYGITDAQSVLNGTGYVKQNGLVTSYDNREFVATTTNQSVAGLKTFVNGISATALYVVNGGYETSIIPNLTYNSVPGGARIQSGNSVYYDYKPLIFTAKQYVLERGNLKLGGNNGFAATGVVDFATERLEVTGNIRYSGTLKPSNIPGTGWLKSNGTTDSWAAITVSDIFELSSFTGFDSRYFTETEVTSFLSTKQNLLSGTGIVLSTDGTISYLTNNSTNWNSAYTFTNGFNTSYPDLVAIEALTGTSGLLKKTAANTWSLDTSSYLTTVNLATDVTGILPIANGGTGSSTKNFVDISSTQNAIYGVKTFKNSVVVSSPFYVGESYPFVITPNLTYNSISGSLHIRAGVPTFYDYKPLIITASNFVLERGNLKLGGNSGFSATGTVDFATERLDITGNIRYSGTLKPSNIAGTGWLYSNGTNDSWKLITPSDIFELSSFTGFDSRYYTKTEISDIIASTIPNGTSGHFLTHNSDGDLVFMNIDIDPVRLSSNKIAVGSPQGILTEVSGFEFVDKRYLSISKKTNLSQKINIGHYVGDSNALIEVIGGRLDLNSNVGLRINNLAGSTTRMMVVDSLGNVSAQAIPSGGSGSNYLPYRRVPYGSAENTQTSDDSLRFYSSVLESELKLGISTPLSFKSDNTGYNNYIQSIGGYINMSSNRISLLVSASGQPNSGEIELSSYHNTLIHSGYGDVIINATEGDVIIKGGAVEWVTTTINGQTRQILCKKL